MSINLRQRRPAPVTDDEDSANNNTTVWDLILWMSRNKEYMNVGYVLAEYATRAAMVHYLPEDKAKSYGQVLGLLGFNVEDVGLWTVGESVMGLESPMHVIKALTTQQRGGGHSAEKVLRQHHKNAEGAGQLAREMVERVRGLAAMPEGEPRAGAHDEMASLVMALPHKGLSMQALQKEAARIYKGHPWFEVGIFCLLNRMRGQPQPLRRKENVSWWLRYSYDLWRLWGQDCLPILNISQLSQPPPPPQRTQQPPQQSLLLARMMEHQKLQ